MSTHTYTHICNIKTDRKKRMIYYEELAYTVMEAEKSHSLPSASWRPRKAGGVIQSEPEGLKPWEPMVQVPVQKQEKANLASE